MSMTNARKSRAPLTYAYLVKQATFKQNMSNFQGWDLTLGA